MCGVEAAANGRFHAMQSLDVSRLQVTPTLIPITAAPVAASPLLETTA
jgi:hypothetical protein